MLWQRSSGQPLREIRTPKDLEWCQGGHGIRATEHSLERIASGGLIEQTPAYQAWEREQNRPIHEPDADGVRVAS